jgi:N-acetylneuraminic acid mutarotase
MPGARVALSAVAANGLLYAAGGSDIQASPLDAFQAYDLMAGGWSVLPSMPTARENLATTTVVDGRVFALGGDNGTGSLGTVEEFDPSTQRWRGATPMPTARALIAAATGADGRIYVMGGVLDRDQFTNVVEVYSPTMNRWTTCAPLPEPRAFGSSAIALPDGRIMVIGGDRDPGATKNFDLDILVYDIATDRWTHEP